MAKTEKRNLKQIGKQWCQQYMSEVTLFIEPQAPSGRRLVAQYEEGPIRMRPNLPLAFLMIGRRKIYCGS
jgi:hypothetical protein